MAHKDEDKMLEALVEDIDTTLIKWMQTYEIPGLNLSGVLLARLVWMAKLGDFKEDLIQLLKAPEEILDKEESTKETFH
jgi:hypothetical protein